MLDSWVTAVVAPVATLLGVALGAGLNSRRESRSAQRSREWNLADQRRAERRDIYVRFLVACDQAMQQARETGLQRTGIYGRKEARRHYLDWMAVANELRLRLTEMRLAAPPDVLVPAERTATLAAGLGVRSLNLDKVMKSDVRPIRQAYDAWIAELIEAMQADLA